MAKDRIGVGWERKYDEGKRSYIAGSLDFGVLGDLPFAVFANERRDETRKQPTHNIVLTVPAAQGGEGDEARRIYLGAAWERQAQGRDSTYLYVKLEFHRLGYAAVEGVDFEGRIQPLFARLVRVTKDGETSPDWVLYRLAEAGQDADGPDDAKECDDASERVLVVEEAA